MTLKEARLAAGLTQQAMSDQLEIPKRTIEEWEAGRRKCPPYVERLVLKELKEIADSTKE
ncbi:MAG: helix-turn-helix transcriptional regulator [Clostridia bacterium]|nr:helix-turn-helix transcriptional regulator [Clostridia bacterium]